MCGRYALDATPEQLVELFELANELDFKPRYNIAPSQLNPVIQHATVEGRLAILAKWGLLPSWAKDPKMAKPINAKSETAASGPMFRAAFRRKRILVPTSGYYEWKAQGSTKQPYFIRLANSAATISAAAMNARLSPSGFGRSLCSVMRQPQSAWHRPRLVYSRGWRPRTYPSHRSGRGA